MDLYDTANKDDLLKKFRGRFETLKTTMRDVIDDNRALLLAGDMSYHQKQGWPDLTLAVLSDTLTEREIAQVLVDDIRDDYKGWSTYTPPHLESRWGFRAQSQENYSNRLATEYEKDRSLAANQVADNPEAFLRQALGNIPFPDLRHNMAAAASKPAGPLYLEDIPYDEPVRQRTHKPSFDDLMSLIS